MDPSDRPASEVFAIEVIEPTRRSRLVRLLVTLGLGVLVMGGATNVGGRRIAIVELGTGQVLATWPEPYGDDAHELLGRITGDLAAGTADEFARAWLADTA